jgi:hypothetical protein
MVPALTPLVVNPPVAPLIPETVIFELPLFFRVTPRTLLLPTFTFPKLNVVGLAPSKKVPAVPVPLRPIAVGDPGTLVLNEMLPVTLPAVVGAKTALNAVVLFGVTVFAVKPVTLKPVPVTLSEETTRFTVPVFFTVIVCELFVPSTTLPKVTLDGVIDIAGSAPVPVSGIAVGEPGRFVDTEILPETPPAEVGAKTALKLMVLPGVRVCAVKLATLKPGPVTLSDETTKFAVPVFFKMIACVEPVPLATAPKLTLDGVTDIAGCVHVPLSATVVGPERFVDMETLPEAAPGDVGAKTALKVRLLLGVSVCAVKPVTPKPVPEAVADETTKFAVPVFFTVIAWVAFAPSATLPKFTVDGVTETPG